ncbi:hypothetical protein TNIN_76951 [Trichonephila inaurata madagascariensis]|uniref:Uncharacterized protein n=1 Tax=Trichonephila inaurata madagascariensis TaxID=2747483 RepID=A0A8X6WRZ8_9ARAC|nr:hypothetical protein TNIN_76951 [Trichonephila inaurata madagascariensis]
MICCNHLVVRSVCIYVAMRDDIWTYWLVSTEIIPRIITPYNLVGGYIHIGNVIRFLEEAVSFYLEYNNLNWEPPTSILELIQYRPSLFQEQKSPHQVSSKY